MKVRVKKTGEIIDVELYRKVPEVTTYVQRKNSRNLLYDSDKLEFLDSTFEITFLSGIFKAEIKIFDGKPLVIRAVDDLCNDIDLNRISIREKILSK